MYKLSIMMHMRPINEFVQAINGEANLNLRTFFLEIKARNRYFSMQPQFFYTDERGPRYAPTFAQDVAGFIGWLPYFNKRWDVACGKKAFKNYARANGLLTPEVHDPNRLPLQNVLLKKSNSSFGNGLTGPFRLLESLDQLQVGPDDYFESFIEGKIAKIWFWNATPAAVELRDMPTLTGDGTSTIGQLLENLPQMFSRKIDETALERTLAYNGYTLTSVPEQGERVLIDYAYMSPFIPPQFKPSNALYDEGLPESCRAQLTHIGNVLNEAIPSEIRANTVYTVDAILNERNEFMLLEANCNPQLHPDVYPIMLRSLFLT